MNTPAHGNRIIYFGPPGTGKTSTLLRHLDEHLDDGVQPQEIAFLTFTRRARQEAISRALKATGAKPRDLLYFKTIHSMAYHALNLREGDVMGFPELQQFGALMGMEFGRKSVSEQAAEGVTSDSEGDHLLALDNLARLRGVEVRQVWKDANSQTPWPTVDQFVRSYVTYKEDKALLDFTDVLVQYCAHGQPLPVAVAFIDEAQDLSALQWLAALKATEQAQQQYVAGDDDQAIYRWAGAEVEMFAHLPGERRVLSHSYRLPRAVHALAQRITGRISPQRRVEKDFAPRDDDGKVVRHASIDGVTIAPGSRWLWLVRNRYLMHDLESRLIEQGIVYTHHGNSSINTTDRDVIYTWERLRAGKAVDVTDVRKVYKLLSTRTQVARGHKLLPDVPDNTALTIDQLKSAHGLLVEGPWFDVLTQIPLHRRMYYRKLLRQTKTLNLTPQVQLETIHGAKGAEAPCVALFLDQSRKTWQQAQTTNNSAEDEHRVWYVGATRAINELHVIEATGKYGYSFPRT